MALQLQQSTMEHHSFVSGLTGQIGLLNAETVGITTLHSVPLIKQVLILEDPVLNYLESC